MVIVDVIACAVTVSPILPEVAGKVTSRREMGNAKILIEGCRGISQSLILWGLVVVAYGNPVRKAIAESRNGLQIIEARFRFGTARGEQVVLARDGCLCAIAQLSHVHNVAGDAIGQYPADLPVK